MSKENDSSDSEKNFNTNDPSTSAFKTENLTENLDISDDDFLDLADEETTQPGQISDRTASNLDETMWGNGSFDLDQLHQLRELYNTRQKRAEEDDEQEYLDAIKERNTDELEQLRNATAVLEQFEAQPYVEEPSTSKPSESRRIRPQRFLAGAGRYPNKLLNREKQNEIDEGIEESKEDEKELLTEVLGGKTQVVKHKRISREVAKLRFSNPGAAFKDNFNLNEDGQSALALDDAINPRATRRAKADASERMRGVNAVQTRSRSERLSEPLNISPQRLIQQPKSMICHNEMGQLVVNSEMVGDYCDCLVEECQGCFFACPDCGSNKCGPICRSRRSHFAYCVAEPRQKTIQTVRFNPFRKAIQRKAASPEKCI